MRYHPNNIILPNALNTVLNTNISMQQILTTIDLLIDYVYRNSAIVRAEIDCLHCTIRRISILPVIQLPEILFHLFLNLIILLTSL